MRNPFKEFGANTDGPFTDAFPITPSDDNDLPEDFRITTHRGEGYSFRVDSKEAAA